MNTFEAIARGTASQNNPSKVFDWDKAAHLIRENQPKEAGAGLSGDWEYTGGTIYRDGQIVTDDYTFLVSTWATPELEMDGDKVDCWKWMSDSGWNAQTKWPESARAILNA